MSNEVWSNTASDQIHNWGTLSHASRGTCSICMSCLTSIYVSTFILGQCLCFCMNAPATMFLVMFLWELPCAYYACIQKPSSPLIHSDTTVELYLSALRWSILYSEERRACAHKKVCKCGITLLIKLLEDFKSGEGKLASKISTPWSAVHAS